MKKERIIIWFRNDLRLHDHEPLFRASQKGAEIIPVYCFDYRQFETTKLGFPKTGNFRGQFLLESVQNLRENLRKKGSDLVIFSGRPEAEIALFARETEANAVYASKEVTSEETYVEDRLEQNLWKLGITVTFFWQSTLYHLDDLTKPISALPDIFTQFRKQVEKYSSVRDCFPSINKLPSLPDEIQVGDLPKPEELSLQAPINDGRRAIEFKGGEDAALQRLNHYFWQTDQLKVYKETRNGLLGADYSSKFSPWLALGCISPRFIYEEVKRYEAERTSNQSTYWLVFELIWRDYFRFVAKKYGNRIFLSTGIKNQLMNMKGKRSDFEKWINGETGIPFIDANMMELKETGFMSNRGRQNVGSFLVKDLKLNWTWGASYFESQLIDYDPCSNWANWNYVAGVGNDPRENRYFNILSQAERYDPKGDYVKHWLPQLKEVPTNFIHTVGDLPNNLQTAYGVRIGVDYPSPLVNYKKWLH